MIFFFCFESSVKGKMGGSDDKYRKAIMTKFYPEIKQKHRFEYIPLNGKANYKNLSAKVKAKLHEANKSSSKEYRVILFLDTDKGNIDSENKNEDIKSFCEKCDYSLVWFNPDVESVLLRYMTPKGQSFKKPASSHEKVEKAKQFAACFMNKRISKSEMTILYVEDVNRQNNCSNLLSVLDSVFHSCGLLP